jgi:glycosyltransferase involved in cell wall biosynthesis
MPPAVSIGLPVYNGENFLGEALHSLCCQSFTDCELIISDNASTDGTRAICESYAKVDGRIRYYRNHENIGVHRNWNRVFELSTGRYFKWAAHDDLYAVDFVEKCVSVLDSDPSVVLCYSKADFIDEMGQHLRSDTVHADATSAEPSTRFYNMIAVDHWCFQIFGVIRSAVLKATPLHADYFTTDRVLLAELSLHGRLYEIPEVLFHRRDHARASTRVALANKWSLLPSYNPAGMSQTRLLAVRRFWEYAAAVRRSSLPHADRMRCYASLARAGRAKVTDRLRRLAEGGVVRRQGR